MNTEYRNEYGSIEREATWTAPRLILAAIALMVVVYGFGFIATGGDLAIYRFWAPKMANAQREVFQNTQSYVQGKTEYIGKLQYQYQTSVGDEKSALRALILNEASTVDISKLPPAQQLFLTQLRSAL